MRFVLDENVSFRVAGHLKAAGLDAVHVGELGLTSTDDAVILVRDVQSLRSADLAGLLVDALASGLAEMLSAG